MQRILRCILSVLSILCFTQAASCFNASESFVCGCFVACRCPSLGTTAMAIASPTLWWTQNMNLVPLPKWWLSSKLRFSLTKGNSPEDCPTLANNVSKPFCPQLAVRCTRKVQSVLHFPRRASPQWHMPLAVRCRGTVAASSKSTQKVASRSAHDGDELLALSRNPAFVGLLCTAIAISILKFVEVRLTCVLLF